MVLNKIAFYRNVRSDVPNQELAKELAETENIAGIKEIAENLWDKNKNIASDCIKVMYETGYIKPELIAGFYDTFLKLLASKNNRMVWGSMIALSTIGHLKSDEISQELDLILNTIENGSVITTDAGIRLLAKLAAHTPDVSDRIFSYFTNFVKNCRSKDLPKAAEDFLQAVTPDEKEDLMAIYRSRRDALTATQQKRIDKVLKKMEAVN